MNMQTTTTTPKERPILFSAPMVRAILEGRKTQTRRIIPEQPNIDPQTGDWLWVNTDEIQRVRPLHEYVDFKKAHCPHGKPGDRLWVRESFYAFGHWETRYNQKKARDEWHFVDQTPDFGPYRYADNLPAQIESGRGANTGWWKRPSLFMPRAASRILLEITDVRAERLQDISEQDAKAEGVNRAIIGNGIRGQQIGQEPRPYAESFFTLWQAINGTESLQQNPFVFPITFKRLQP